MEKLIFKLTSASTGVEARAELGKNNVNTIQGPRGMRYWEPKRKVPNRGGGGRGTLGVNTTL